MTTAEQFLAELRGESPGQSAEEFLAEMRGEEFIPPASPEEVIEATGGTVEEPLPAQPEPGLGEKIKGTLEAIEMMGFGGAAGTFGFAGGTIEGLLKEMSEFSTDPIKQAQAADRVMKLAEQRASEFSRPFAPESEVGQELVKDIGEIVSQIPIVPHLAIEANIIKQSARAGLNIIPAKTAQINKQMQVAADVVRKNMAERNRQSAQAPLGSVGAQAIEIDQIRRQSAQDLPVPIQLTKGQATRGFEQQRFERETAKLPEPGEPLRQRFADQNAQLIQNFDAFIDETGADLYYPTEIGEVVERAIRADAAKDMARIRKLYKSARESGGMSKKVDMSPLSDYLNVNRAERAENSIMNKVQRQLEVLEVADGSFEDGSLSLKSMNLNQAEAVRRFINRNVNDADPNDIRIATSLKNLIDASTEGQGNEKYKAARQARLEYGEKFENVGLINNILGTKRGTVDRIIALEDVTRKSILSPSTSIDSTKHLRRILQNAGEDGKQAWRELQGSTLRHLQDQMTKNVARNERGDPVVSAAILDREIRSLDRAGKLELMFGKKGAEQLRTINDVANVVLTSPPGAVNTSNTATVLAGLMDIAVSGSAGIPAPLFTAGKLLMDGLKDKKLKKQVAEALKTEEVK